MPPTPRDTFNSAAPDPLSCHTYDDIVNYLSQLKSRTGMSIRDIASAVRKLRNTNAPADSLRSTIDACFQAGRKRMNHSLVMDMAAVMGQDREALTRLEQALAIASGWASETRRADVRQRLPEPRRCLVGRESELASCVDVSRAAADAGRPCLLAITGLGGIGKTELAVHLANRLMESGNFAGPRLFADLHGMDTEQPPTTSDAVLDGFLRLLGCSRSDIRKLDSLESKMQLYRRLLSRRPAIILLDNVGDIDQIRPLFVDDDSHVVIVTSRSRMGSAPWTKHVELTSLDNESATNLLRTFDNTDRCTTGPRTVERLAVDVCQAIPFNLVTLGAQLADPTQSDWTLADHEQRLRSLSADQTIRPVLSASYESLEPQVQNLFRMLALLPAGQFTVHEAAALTAPSDHDPETDLDQAVVKAAQDGLNRLYDRHLVSCPESQRYRVPEIVRSFACWLLQVEVPASRKRHAQLMLRDLRTRRIHD